MRTTADYEEAIRKTHAMLIKYPDNETLKSRLEGQLTAWAASLQIRVDYAKNEKLPWTAEELGYETDTMRTKKDSGIAEVGDYMAYIYRFGVYCTTLVERKGGTNKDRSGAVWGAEDLYGTMMNSKRRARFYREHKRFQQDPRFKNGKMILIAECTLEDFLEYTPLFNGKSRNVNHIGASVASRLGTIAALYERGIPVLFAGNRKRATELYHKIVQQNIIKNYCTHLNLQPIGIEQIEIEEEGETEDAYIAV